MSEVKIVDRNDLMCGVFKFDVDVTLDELKETVTEILQSKDGTRYESIIIRPTRKSPWTYGIAVRFSRGPRRPAKYIKEMRAFFTKRHPGKLIGLDVGHWCVEASII